MTKLSRLVWLGALALALNACSSSETTEEGLDAGTEAAQAQTDFVPEDGAELNDQMVEEVVNNEPVVTEETKTKTETFEETETPVASYTPVTGSGQFDTYTIQRGDTLMKIAFEHYGDLYQWRRIYEANRDQLADPNFLRVGTVIKVEKAQVPVSITRNGEKYMVKPGDTLGTISKDVYGTSGRWKDIWKNNPEMIRNPNKIYHGFHVYYVPGQGGSMAPDNGLVNNGAEPELLDNAPTTERTPSAAGSANDGNIVTP